MKKLIAIILMVLLVIGCTAFAEEEEVGQNPAMNVMGDYEDTVGQRATMHVDPIGDNDADVTIRWANSASETVEWHFSGPCSDTENLEIPYSNCVKKTITTAEDGTTTEKVDYENGTGKLSFTNEDTKATWKDDQEDAGKDCVFEYVVVDNTTKIGEVAMCDSETELREKMGDPASEGETAGLKDLTYTGIQVANRPMDVHFLIGQNGVEAIRISTREGNADVANDLSVMMDDMGNGADPNLTEDQVKSLATKFCGIEDFSQLTYAAQYAKDGCTMLYIRTSEKNIDLLILSHYQQDKF